MADHKTIYDAARVNKATATAYERLLFDLLIIDQVPAWTSNRLKRLVRRTEQGRHEIDLVAELAGQELIGVEVKATAAPTARDAKHLLWLRDELGERFVAGVVLHSGPRTL